MECLYLLYTFQIRFNCTFGTTVEFETYRKIFIRIKEIIQESGKKSPEDKFKVLDSFSRCHAGVPDGLNIAHYLASLRLHRFRQQIYIWPGLECLDA